MGLLKLTIVEGKDFEFFHNGNSKKPLRLIRGNEISDKDKKKGIYIKLSVLKESRKFEKTLVSYEAIPFWNESFELNVEKPEKHALFLQVVGREGVDKVNDLVLGTISIKLWAVPPNQDQDIWVKLKNSLGGSLHLKFKFEIKESQYTSQIFSFHRDVNILPNGWEIYTHDTTGTKLFVHHSTKTVSEHDPRGEIGKDISVYPSKINSPEEDEKIVPLFGNWKNEIFSLTEGPSPVNQEDPLKKCKTPETKEESIPTTESLGECITLSSQPSKDTIVVTLIPVTEQRKKELDQEWNELITKVVN